MNAERFRRLLEELIDENPFAIRAALKVLEVCFTESVPTLAVTCEERPRLKVNLKFVSRHCRSDAKVKAVICHEFLHVLLRHTEQRTPLTRARHLAFDAVINAIIHREYGPGASALMSDYYADATDLTKLLRPMNAAERNWYVRHGYPANVLPQWAHAWDALYAGRLVADDIEALASDLEKSAGTRNSPGTKGIPATGGGKPGPFKLEGGIPNDIGGLLGGHDTLGHALPAVLEEALERTLKEMNGSGIWRAPGSRGVGANPYEALFTGKDDPMRRWQRRTLAILRAHVMPDRHSRARAQRGARLPHTGSVALGPARVREVPVAAVPAGFRVADRGAAARGHHAGVSRRFRVDERRDAADHRAPGAALAAHPPAVLGVQHDGRRRR